MARTRNTTATTSSSRPGLMSRLRYRKQPAKVTTSTSTNPITGSRTTTKKTTTHPNGLGHHGHGGRGPLASDRTIGVTTNSRTAGTHHHRKPSVGDKVSGAMMKLRGSLTKKPGLKVCSLYVV